MILVIITTISIITAIIIIIFSLDCIGYACRNFRKGMLKLEIISVMDLSSNNEKKASNSVLNRIHDLFSIVLFF